MEDRSAKKSSKGMVECATASLYEREDHKRSGKNVRFVRFTPPPPPPPLSTIRNESFFRVDGGWRCWQAARACILRFLPEDLDGRAITKNLQKRGLALPYRCTEVLYHTAVLAGDRVGRWGVSRIFGALLALSCQLRGVRARRPRSQGDMQQSRMHLSQGGSQINGENCLTIGGFGQVDGFGLT